MKQSLFILALLLAFATGACAQTAALDQALKERDGQYEIDYIKSLLEQGIDTQGNYRRSPLIIATQCRYTDLVKALIEAGADLNIQASEGRTALMEASVDEQNGPDAEIATMLINAGADVNIKANDGGTALLYVTYYYEPELVQLLIDKGADTNVVNSFGDTPLDNAANYEDIVEMLKKAGAGTIDPLAGIKGKVSEGVYRILQNETYDSTIQTIVKLLEDNINAQDDGGRTALIHAILNCGNIGADDEPEDIIVMTTTPDSAYTANLPLIKELIAMGADINLADNKGYTPLINAIKKKKKEIVRILIAAKADLNKGDNEGVTPLMYAKTPEDIDLLLQYKADINAVDNYGLTALMRFAWQRKTKLVKALIEHKADVNVTDKQGKRTLKHAGSEEVQQMLIDAGAK